MIDMRIRVSLLLAAGLLGCQSVPVREDAAATQAPDAQQVAAPLGPTMAHRRSTRTKLYIPPAYYELLNWDPAAFEDTSTPQPERMGETRANGAGSGNRATRRRQYRGWRGRRGRQRGFRTVGLGVTVSRFGGGHAMGLPGQAVGVPGQAAGVPGRAVGRPGQAVRLPGQAVGLPRQAVGLPAQAVRRPGQAVRLPGQAVRQPGQAVKLPGQAVRRPKQAVNLPGHPVGRP